MIDTGTIHSGRKGDTVVVSAHRVGHAERVGVILEVLGEPGRIHYRVRWETGNETVLYPSSDATIRRKTARRATAKR
jgi:uncharacterized protein DUF1918